jgi:branched-chain amino acid transport system permease protein
MSFFFEVLVGGLLAGVMYSMVALGFVLIYKASGAFNFAQGSMVLFGALTFVSLTERGVSFVLALALTVAVMLALALSIERVVLRRLVNRPVITLFMATLGLSFIIEGLAQLLWGSQVHGLELGVPDRPFEVAGVMISAFDLFAAGTAAALVLLLGLLFNKTLLRIPLRAAADDALAAVAVGLDLRRLWALVWAISGVVAVVAGLLWGARVGVQFSLSLIVLKALPVLIIGGFGSIAGSITGGLLVGATEKLAEVYLGPPVGGGIENWFPYVLAMLFLLVKPAGLFGERRVERV